MRWAEPSRTTPPRQRDVFGCPAGHLSLTRWDHPSSLEALRASSELRVLENECPICRQVPASCVRKPAIAGPLPARRLLRTTGAHQQASRSGVGREYPASRGVRVRLHRSKNRRHRHDLRPDDPAVARSRIPLRPRSPFRAGPRQGQTPRRRTNKT